MSAYSLMRVWMSSGKWSTSEKRYYFCGFVSKKAAPPPKEPEWGQAAREAGPWGGRGKVSKVCC